MSAWTEWRDRLSTSGRGLFAAVVAVAVLPAMLFAQAPVEEGEGAGVEDAPAAIEWNFERVPVVTPSTDVSIQERWAAPFAVVSQGGMSARERREVVVRDETTTPVEGSGDSASVVAVVTVEEGESAPPGTAEDAEAENPSPPSDPPARSPANAGDATAESSSGEPSSGARTHRVAYGETWYGLAGEYRVSAAALAAANPAVDPERLRAGTVLRIPDREPATPPRRTYTVARGDTLYGIARRYGVTAAEIRSANNLSGDIVRLGQTLVIPQEEDTDE